MLFPKSLKKGDTVAIVSTARKISIKELSFATQWLNDLGFNVILGKSIGLVHHQFAGTDALRARDFQEMMDNTNVKAIWCARGGYGTVRIIDLLDFNAFKKNPKWVIGYSDITVLHSHLHYLGLPSLHGPLAFDIEKATAEAKNNLASILLGNATSFSFPANHNNRLGAFSGIAVGGNLSVLYSLCGSDSAIDTEGKILFLEDLDEYLYHMDRMLWNLDRNGMLSNLKALVIGGITSMHDNAIPFGYSVKEIILEITSKYNYPVVFNAPFGHIKDNRTIVFGKDITLVLTSNACTLMCEAI